MRRPGSRLRAALARRLSDKAMWQCIDPAVADLQAEYALARREGRIWRSRWIRICGYGALLNVVAGCSWRESLEGLRCWSPDDTRVAGRVLALSGLVTIVLTALAMGGEYPKFPDKVPTQLFVYLIPYALSLTMPAGIMLGVIVALPNRRRPARLVAAIVAMALVCSVAMFVNLNWVTPSANQAFRLEIFRLMNPYGILVGDLPKGYTEMTLSELRAVRPDAGGFYRYPHAAAAYHRRWAMSFTPLALVLFALSIRARRRILVAVAAAAALLLSLLTAGWLTRSNAPPFLVAWLPNLLFASFAVRNLMRLRPVPGD
jgi:hypothetical protein